MSLNKADFTDEQWAEIQAEADRRASSASETARKNATTAAAADVEAKIAAAIEEQRKLLEMDEHQKLEVERAKVEEARSALAKDSKALKATKKLLAAGFEDEAIESLLPMFTVIDDKSFDTSVDSFIKVNETLVKAKIDSVKQELLANATPPASPSGAPVDALAAAAAAIKNGDDAGAIDMLLSTATPQ